jgi:hypothetical protein
MGATLTLAPLLVSRILLTNHNPRLNTMTSSPTMSRKRTIKPEPDSSTSDSNPPSPETPSKKAKSHATPKTKTPKYSPTRADAWTPEFRLRLFEAYEASSQVKWDEVAKLVSFPPYRLIRWLTRRWEMERMQRLVGSSGSVLLGRRSRLRLARRARLEIGKISGTKSWGAREGGDTIATVLKNWRRRVVNIHMM